jgi:MFS transporter, DHA2 family, multidrug resistance protein
MPATFPALRPVGIDAAPSVSPWRLRRAASRNASGADGGAGLRSWFGLAVLVLAALLVSIDNTVLSVAVPAITAALAPSATQLLWMIDVYPLVLAGLLVTMGTLGDRVGRRKLLLVGAAGFGAVSLMAAFAADGVQLIVARALLGLFGSMLMPATLALLRTLFTDATQRRFAIAVWASGFAAGAAAGPLLGGLLLDHFWWGSVFLVNVPVTLALLVALPLVVRESRNPGAGKLDPLGVALSMLAMAPTVLAVKLVAHDGPSLLAGVALAVGSASAVLFVQRCRARLAAGEEPLLDVTLFRSPVLRLSALANATTMFAYTGLLFFSAQYLTLVVGLDPLATGLVLLPGFVVTMVSGLLASALGRRFPLHALVPAGMLLAALGLGLCAFLGTHSVGLLMAASVLFGAGIGLSETITNDAILAAAPADRAGSASAVSETAYEVGAVVGTAVLGSVLGAVYSALVVAPAQAPEAGETLGGAMAAAARLPEPLAELLQASARTAFVTGVEVSSAVGVVALLGVALSVFRLRRRALV